MNLIELLFGKKSKKSVREYDDWKQLQYYNEVSVESYNEQKMIDEECKNSIPIYKSKLWD